MMEGFIPGMSGGRERLRDHLHLQLLHLTISGIFILLARITLHGNQPKDFSSTADNIVCNHAVLVIVSLQQCLPEYVM